MLLKAYRLFRMPKRSYPVAAAKPESDPRPQPNSDSVYGKNDVNVKDTPFRRQFKYYKARKPPPDFSNVVEIDDASGSHQPLLNIDSFSADFERLRLQQPDCWKFYAVNKHPGLFILRNCLNRSAQYEWVKTCLEDYTKPPQRTNIDSFITDYCTQNGQNRDSYDILSNPKSIKKLRWSTLGYHHNWDTKVYSDDNRSETPSQLNDLCNTISKLTVGYDFKAEAAICHFYHLDSTLSGHVDHSEPNQDAPLVAISLGQSAVFLMGGETLDVRPDQLWLRSGDVMLMTGPSRRCYHAVPRIVQDVVFDPLPGEDCRILKYMNENRINLNVRQVY